MKDNKTRLQAEIIEDDSRGKLSYVLITPARNEEAFIEGTIKSVIRQTVLPLKWIIVSDGSTDRTDDIVLAYATLYDWLELVRMPEHHERHFAGKVHAFKKGCEKIKGFKYDIIGNLDADITFEADYMSFLLSKFSEDPRLGVAGTPFKEEGKQYDYRFTSIEHVSGACQLFRRECYEDIGGYIPLKVGGVDLVAVLSARKKGWQTRTFTDKICEHHRKTQYGQHSTLFRTFKSGYHDYLMGGAPVWQLFRSLYQMTKNPVIVGGSFLLLGYLWAFVKQAEKPIPDELVAFRRKEQTQRLRLLFARCFFQREAADSNIK